MPISFPSDYDDNICYVVAINKALIPLVGGLLQITEKRGFWVTDDDYDKGYNAIVALEACLMATCLQDFMQLQEAQYRLLNTAIFGQDYVVESTDPLVVTPAIAPAVDLAVYGQNSIMGRLDRVTKLVDSSVNGTDNDLYTYHPSVRELLQSVIDALGADDTDLEGILSTLETIALLVA